VGKAVPDFVLHGFPHAFIVARKTSFLSYTYPHARLCQAAITPGQNSTRTGGQNSTRADNQAINTGKRYRLKELGK
jgi:hypothetical protein